MFQMKEQDKISKEKLSEEETGNLPEKEFTVMIIKMIEEFERSGRATFLLKALGSVSFTFPVSPFPHL